MFDVAVVGAGELGGALAHSLARRDIVSMVHLVDESGSIAVGKALDITQSAPVDGFATRVNGAVDIATAAGASMVVLADHATGEEWGGDEGLALLRRLSTAAGGLPLVLCAGASQREMIERGARELRLPRSRLFGSAPEALASAIRAIVALESNASPRDIALTVLGVPPDHVVVPWEEATIGGLSAVNLLDQPARRRLDGRVAQLWPPGPFALAAAAVKVVEIVVRGSRQIVSAFIAPDDSEGRKMRAAALPARADTQGVVGIGVPPLTPHDRVALETAILL